SSDEIHRVLAERCIDLRAGVKDVGPVKRMTPAARKLKVAGMRAALEQLQTAGEDGDLTVWTGDVGWNVEYRVAGGQVFIDRPKDIDVRTAYPIGIDRRVGIELELRGVFDRQVCPVIQRNGICSVEVTERTGGQVDMCAVDIHVGGAGKIKTVGGD